MKVKIKNFQSAEDVSFDINGFTVLVGKSNIGKSAIVRAIQGALVNTPADAYITVGQKHTEVELETDDAHILWRKGGGHNDYIINGTPLDNVGRGSVPELEALGFGEIKIAGESISVQVADQWHPLFLLDAKGSTAAEAISDVGRLTEVQEALKNCDKDRREVKSIRKVREKDIEDVRRELQKFATYEQDRKAVVVAQETVKSVQAVEKDIGHIRTLVDKKDRIEGVCDLLKDVDLISIREWEDDLYNEVRDLERIAASKEKIATTITTLRGVDDIVVTELEFDTQGLKTLEALVKRLGTITPTIKTLRGVEDIVVPDPPVKDESIGRLESILQRAVRVGRTAKKYQGVEDIVVPDVSIEDLGIKTLDTMMNRLEAIKVAIPKLKDDIQTLDINLEELDNEIHVTLHEAGVCPMCERTVE